MSIESQKTPNELVDTRRLIVGNYLRVFHYSGTKIAKLRQSQSDPIVSQGHVEAEIAWQKEVRPKVDALIKKYEVTEPVDEEFIDSLEEWLKADEIGKQVDEAMGRTEDGPNYEQIYVHDELQELRLRNNPIPEDS